MKLPKVSVLVRSGLGAAAASAGRKGHVLHKAGNIPSPCPSLFPHLEVHFIYLRSVFHLLCRKISSTSGLVPNLLCFLFSCFVLFFFFSFFLFAVVDWVWFFIAVVDDCFFPALEI